MVVIKGNLDRRGILDDVVVRYDIAVGTDNDTGTAAFLLTGLRLAITILVSEEEAEERVDLLVLLTGLYRHLDIDDSLNRSFGGIGEIRIVRFCQIDSFHRIVSTLGRLFTAADGRNQTVNFITGLNYAISRQSAQKDR